MSAPTVEARVTPQRRLVAAGKRFGNTGITWSYPQTQADKAAHAAASYVRIGAEAAGVAAGEVGK